MPSESPFPDVPLALVEKLEATFVEEGYIPGDSVEQYAYKGGQINVVRFLRAKYEANRRRQAKEAAKLS